MFIVASNKTSSFASLSAVFSAREHDREVVFAGHQQHPLLLVRQLRDTP